MTAHTDPVAELRLCALLIIVTIVTGDPAIHIEILCKMFFDRLLIGRQQCLLRLAEHQHLRQLGQTDTPSVVQHGGLHRAVVDDLPRQNIAGNIGLVAVKGQHAVSQQAVLLGHTPPQQLLGLQQQRGISTAPVILQDHQHHVAGDLGLIDLVDMEGVGIGALGIVELTVALEHIDIKPHQRFRFLIGPQCQKPAVDAVVIPHIRQMVGVARQHAAGDRLLRLDQHIDVVIQPGQSLRHGRAVGLSSGRPRLPQRGGARLSLRPRRFGHIRYLCHQIVKALGKHQGDLAVRHRDLQIFSVKGIHHTVPCHQQAEMQRLIDHEVVIYPLIVRIGVKGTPLRDLSHKEVCIATHLFVHLVKSFHPHRGGTKTERLCTAHPSADDGTGTVGKLRQRTHRVLPLIQGVSPDSRLWLPHALILPVALRGKGEAQPVGRAVMGTKHLKQIQSPSIATDPSVAETVHGAIVFQHSFHTVASFLRSKALCIWFHYREVGVHSKYPIYRTIGPFHRTSFSLF